MVNGEHMVFSKVRMVDRLIEEGVFHSEKDIPEDVIAIMDNLDDQEVGTNSWARQVYGYPVYTCEGKDGKHYDVNQNDCVGKGAYDLAKEFK